MGYEEPSNEEYERMKRCWHFEFRNLLVVNPVVTIASVIILWGFVIAAMVSPDYMLNAMNDAAFEWIPEVWTWLYIVSQDIWIVVLLYVMYKYGHLKLGKDDDVPQFSTATWFAMLFSAGVAVGLFYYGVAEPLWHYKTSSAHWASAAKGYGNVDEDANMAMFVTWYHWGLHGWIPYTTMGAVLAIMTYRRGFPMTIRYCFWPLIGEKCYGIIGDIIDILSIITTIAGVCTSLGLGAMQINQGVQRLDHGFYRGVNYAIPDDEKFSTPDCEGTGKFCDDNKESYGVQVNVSTQCIIIAVITVIAALSVSLGLGKGIANLSRFCFALGNFLMLLVLFHGETWFILDTFVQGLGYYIWFILKYGFHCDAYERLGGKDMGLGGATDGNGGGSAWLSGWTLFYWGWWISWGPFVGTFLARISKGRTLREFICCTLLVPSIYSFLWFSVFGAEGIRMQRLADGSGLCSIAALDDVNSSHCTEAPHGNGASGYKASTCLHYSESYSTDFKKARGMGWNPSCVLDPNYHGGHGKCKEYEWTRWVRVGEECVKSTSWVSVPCGSTADPTELTKVPTKGPCKDKIMEDMINVNKSDRMYNIFTGGGSREEDCFVPLQDGVVCLINQGTTSILFDQLSSYGPRGFSDFISLLGIVALALYFVTSSDSGSFVVDIISANGHPDPPLAQRIFWSLTEGATAIALLAAGRNLPNSEGSLRALQSASLIMGLPYTIILFYCSQALVLLAKEEGKDLDQNRKSFNRFIFAPNNILNFVTSVFAPGIVMGKAASECGGWPGDSFGSAFTKIFWTVFFMVLYWGAIILNFIGLALYNWHLTAAVLHIGFGILLGLVRNGVRHRYSILHGDLFSDMMCGIFAPPFTISQIADQMANDQPAKKVDGVDGAAPGSVSPNEDSKKKDPFESI